MLQNSKTFATAAFAALVMTQGAQAADLFSVTTSVNGVSSTAAFKNAEDALDAVTNERLRIANPGYTENSQAAVNIAFRGLPVSLNYAQDSRTLVFEVKSLGIREEFTGATRDASENQFEDYFKKNGKGILDRLFKELARVSPVDPIAGNPNSLMSRQVAQDFSNGTMPFAGKQVDGAATNNLVGINPSVGSFTQNGIRSKAFTIPLSYIVRADLDPRRQFGFNLPITVVDTDGAKTYGLAPSVFYRHPVMDGWSLTPSLGLGLTGSEDLASLGSLWSASLTSNFVFELGGHDITIGNMVGRYQSLKIRSGDYSADPGIKNTVLKNGVTLTEPVAFLGRMGSVDFSYANTRFYGTDLYAENYNEFGVSVGTNRSAQSARSYFRAGISYLRAANSRGFSANIGYWF